MSEPLLWLEYAPSTGMALEADIDAAFARLERGEIAQPISGVFRFCHRIHMDHISYLPYEVVAIDWENGWEDAT